MKTNISLKLCTFSVIFDSICKTLFIPEFSMCFIQICTSSSYQAREKMDLKHLTKVYLMHIYWMLMKSEVFDGHSKIQKKKVILHRSLLTSEMNSGGRFASVAPLFHSRQPRAHQSGPGLVPTHHRCSGPGL